MLDREKYGRRSSVEVRARALELVADGASFERVGRAVGFPPQTVGRWAAAAGWSARLGRRGGLDGESLQAARLSVLPAVDMDADFTDARGRLTAGGRALIQYLIAEGFSDAVIARKVGVHRSSVGREIARAGGRDAYRARLAQEGTDGRARRPRALKLDTPAVRAAVALRLDKRWSPVQVAADLRRSYPDREDMWVSHETIYQALYVQGKGSLRNELTVLKALRSGRTGRKPRSKLPPRASNRAWIGEDNHISARPPEAADRAVPGHWEGDLVLGAKNADALITLVERSTRMVLIRRLPDRHDAPTVTQALKEMIADLPTQLRRSLTWDQGAELASHAEFTVATNCPVYFCDPHSPWQRGTNENTNGLIRDFFPKGTSFADVTDAEIQEAQDLLNTRPRQTLNWDTPAARLNALLKVA